MVKAKSKIVVESWITADSGHRLWSGCRIIGYFITGKNLTQVYMRSDYLRGIGVPAEVSFYTRWDYPLTDVNTVIRWIEHSIDFCKRNATVRKKYES
jgi:hypothetical protein